ncbi:hypothetical protein TNCV_4365641 [Trichonephila clavipes]|nr:hypothetical protein TNCV_4365641 [Trichonephila clavipes]
MALLAVPLGLSLNPGEDIHVCKCIVPMRFGGTLSSRRVTSPIGKLVKLEQCRGPLTPQGTFYKPVRDNIKDKCVHLKRSFCKNAKAGSSKVQELCLARDM